MRSRIITAVLTSTALLGSFLSTLPSAHATFPGRNGRIVFTRNQSRNSPNPPRHRVSLFTMNPNGTDVVQLTDPPWGEVDSEPSWSPDGTRIAFQRDLANDQCGTPGDCNIYTVRPDGTGLKQITSCSHPGNRCWFSGNPTWTPDGRTIVFVHCCVLGNGGGFQNIYRMRADGTHVRRLTLNTDLNWGDDEPTVSPDGRWVAFSRTVGAKDDPVDKSVSAMFLVRLNGTGLRRITPYSLMVDEKDWSPDGSKILFTSHAGSNSGPFRADILTVHPDGTHLTQLTHTTPGSTFAFFPSWSPNGKRIAFDYFPSSGCVDIYTMRADGSGAQQETSSTQCEGALDWGPQVG